MALIPGNKLGRYQLVSPIGEGGMGEVWKARDTQLDRDVALKVSKAAFTARFAQEARAIAAFNHPNICQIYDVGANYLVMELIDGLPLKGPLPAGKAIAYAALILDALDAAHRKGFTHRDLKPANILVSKQGIKLLDFGLAKRTAHSLGEDDETEAVITVQGQISGTLQYMSPEQLQGKEADARSDIFSFGCVLYEMLSGRLPFPGSTAASVIAAILEREPEPLKTAPPLERVIRNCLDKDPDKRIQNALDLKHDLVWAMEITTAAPRKSRMPLMGAGALVIAAVAVVAAIALWAPWRAGKQTDLPLARFSIDLGPDAVRGARVTAVLSPDGTRLVFIGRAKDELLQLFTRRVDQADAVPLEGTASPDTSYPFFSPDGMWIGFIAEGKIHKVASQGGAAVVVGDAPQINMGVSWGDDGNIVAGSPAGLMRTPASGGALQDVERGAEAQIFPQVLPGATAVLFNTIERKNNLDGVDIEALDFRTGKKKTLLRGGYFPRYLPTSGDTGHLVYMHDGTLFGVAFNPKDLEVHGTPVPLLDDIAASRASIAMAAGSSHFPRREHSCIWPAGFIVTHTRSLPWTPPARPRPCWRSQAHTDSLVSPRMESGSHTLPRGAKGWRFGLTISPAPRPPSSLLQVPALTSWHGRRIPDIWYLATDPPSGGFGQMGPARRKS